VSTEERLSPFCDREQHLAPLKWTSAFLKWRHHFQTTWAGSDENENLASHYNSQADREKNSYAEPRHLSTQRCHLCCLISIDITSLHSNNTYHMTRSDCCRTGNYSYHRTRSH